MYRCVRALAIAGVLVPPLLALAAPAQAHGSHTQGDLVITVGFLTEPAYAGQPNAVELGIEHDGDTVTDLPAGDLSVDVSFADQTTTLAVEPNFEVGEWGTPGQYVASFIPSAPGSYTFHVTGTVDREAVDFSMKSGPDTFSDVLDPAEATFPATDAPTTADLAARMQADAASLADASDAADGARTIAIVGVVVGLAGLALAGVALARTRRG
jgi:hypothetical protein